MNPRLTRGEYWILEVCVDSGTPVHWFFPENYSGVFPHTMECQFNKADHGLGRDCLIETLVRMFQDGWIEAHRYGQPPILNCDEFIAALNTRSEVFEEWTHCRLSTSGGAVWEAFASPCWEEFLLEDFDLEARRGTVTCMTHWRGDHYLRNLHLMGYEVDLGSIFWEEIGEWEATYWGKRLPRGYRGSFRWFRENNEESFDNPAEFSVLCDFRDGWYRWR